MGMACCHSLVACCRSLMVCCSRQSAIRARIVAVVMDLHRCGGLRRATLYEVSEVAGKGGEANLKNCVDVAEGKVR
jgi:hypothetical protein